jgi:glutaredoxin
MYTIYTKPNCTFCDQAKALLSSKGLAFESIKLGEGISRDELLAKIPTARTMPQIMKDGTLIGGFQELRKELL